MKLITIKEIIQELGEPPLCACGCGNKVKITASRYNIYKKHGYSKFCKNHNTKINIKNLIQELGVPILCACGCGNKININPRNYAHYKKNGYPKFLQGHSNRNIPKSNDHKEKIKFSVSGKNNGMYNKKHSQESKQKMSLAGFGKLKSESTKQHMKENHANFSGKNNPMYGKMSGSNNPIYGKIPSKYSGIGQRRYYNSPFQGIIYFRSTYEYKYALYLDRNNIPWLYEPKAFKISENNTYRPDFLLLNECKFIEIKGWMRQSDQQKIDLFLKQYKFNLEILRKDDLIKLGIKVK